MKKVDIEGVCKTFNTLRQENLHKIFTPNEMQDLLSKHGIAKGIFRKMAQNAFFRVRKAPNSKGNCKEYVFTDFPIYKAQFEKIYQDMRDYKNGKTSRKVDKNLSDEEAAIQLLKSLGYSIKRPVGINEAALKKELPKIYAKYLTMQEV